jgi:hypothetical protein
MNEKKRINVITKNVINQNILFSKYKNWIKKLF